MRFEWDEEKNRRNLRKHQVRFETAVLVFDDPFSMTQPDEYSGEEERWITLGAVGPGAILLVVHTWRQTEGDEVIRIISARAAAGHERKRYEEAHQGTKKRYRRDHGKTRRGY